MTQTVTLPGGDVLEFPDEMSPGTMESLVKRHVQQQATSPGSDVAKALPYSIPKAITALSGLPGDLRELANAGRSAVESKLPQMPDWVSKVNAAASVANPLSMWPTSSQLRSGVEQATGPWYDPQTRVGKIADTGAQTALTMGRNWLTTPGKAAALTTGITAGTEGAGAATGDNPWARLLGGIFGGGVVSAKDALKSRPGAVVRDAIGTPTQAEIDGALARQTAALSQGVPLLGTESFDRGHQLASYLRSQPTGASVLDPFLNKRPGQVDAAVNRDIIGPTGPRATPQANAGRAQSAAERAIAGLEQDRTNLVAPDYFRARNEQLPQSVVDVVKRRVDGAANAAPVSDRGLFAPYINDLSAPNATNAATLDAIYKRARDASNLPINASTADKQAAAAARTAAPALEQATQQSQNLARGRQQYQDFTRNEIEPVTSGPVGVVAGKKGYDPAEPSPVPRVASTVADANTARPETIRALYTHLNAQDSQAFPGIVQTHLENQLNGAMEKLRSGPNPTAGAKFNQAIRGTPQEQANFNEMMRGVAKAHGLPEQDVIRGANNLLDTLELTGRTPGIGSPTQPRQEIAGELKKTKITDAMDAFSAKPLGGVSKRLSDWVSRGRTEQLARVLTAPDSVEQLVKLAKLKPSGLTASYYAASLLGLANATSQ